MKYLLATMASLLISQQAFAYQSFLSTGDITPEGQFYTLGYIEAVFDEFDGVNFNARGGMSISDEVQIEVELGFGEFDIYLAGFAKWVPIPDYDKQPAIGVRAGLSYIKIDDFNETIVSAAPFVSKLFDTKFGPLTPFAAIPLGIANNSGGNPNDDDTFFTSRLIIGSEWQNPNWSADLKIIGEIGFELTDSFNSFNLGASYNF